MNEIVESIPNLYRMVSNLCGMMDPFEYAETCPRGCTRCSGEEGFFILYERHSPEHGRSIRSVPITPSNFSRLLRTAPQDIWEVERVLTQPVREMMGKYIEATGGYFRRSDDHTFLQYNPWYIQPPMELTGRYAMVWTNLPSYHHRQEALVFPDMLEDWPAVAKRWLTERIPDISVYRVRVNHPYRHADVDLSVLSQRCTAQGDYPLHIDESTTVLSVRNLPSMTRFQLLSNPSISDGEIPLYDWYTRDEEWDRKMDGMVLRIGQRLVWMDVGLELVKRSARLLHRSVADQLAIASTVMGYTELSITEIALLAGTLWAYSALRLGPLTSKRLIPTNSHLLTTYLIHSVDEPELLTEMLRRSCKLTEGQLRYNRTYIFPSWKAPQDRLLSVVNLLRSQLGKPSIQEEMEVVYGASHEDRHDS